MMRVSADCRGLKPHSFGNKGMRRGEKLSSIGNSLPFHPADSITYHVSAQKFPGPICWEMMRLFMYLWQRTVIRTNWLISSGPFSMKPHFDLLPYCNIKVLQYAVHIYYIYYYIYPFQINGKKPFIFFNKAFTVEYLVFYNYTKMS